MKNVCLSIPPKSQMRDERDVLVDDACKTHTQKKETLNSTEEGMLLFVSLEIAWSNRACRSVPSDVHIIPSPWMDCISLFPLIVVAGRWVAPVIIMRISVCAATCRTRSVRRVVVSIASSRCASTLPHANHGAVSQKSDVVEIVDGVFHVFKCFE